MSIDLLLSRLDGVRPIGPGKWMALCPAHGDKSPSLSIRETEDGRILLHCWSGCRTDAVIAAIGCEWRDLFAPDSGQLGARRPGRDKVKIELAKMVCAIARADMRAGRQIRGEDMKTLREALATLREAGDVV